MEQPTYNPQNPDGTWEAADTATRSPSPFLQIVGWGLVNFFILTAAMLAAVQFRTSISLGRPLGETYEPHFVTLYSIILVVSIGTYLLGYFGRGIDLIGQHLHIQRQFRQLIAATGISSVVVLLFLPGVSQLQMIYYAFMAMLLGAFLILIPGRLRQNAYRNLSIIDNLRQVHDHRHLLKLWLSYRIRSRYAQTLLGILWIIILPVMQSAVLAFAFTQLLGRGASTEVPFVAFLLSGAVIFGIFQSLVMRGVNALNGMRAVIKQVYFPREIIIVLLAGEVLVDFSFTFIALLVINAFLGILPNVYFLLLPIPIVLCLILGLGTSFLVTWLSLIIKDMQPLVGVLMQLMFYVTVLFNINMVSE
ncbi:MAG: hypothetical protein AAFR22_26370, partial [Chloroflexota bacterium]